MFWSDPNLYGFTYKDINTPVQAPFFGAPVFNPWQNIPRFMPPTYGFNYPLFNLPQYTLPQFSQFSQFPQIPQIPQVPQVPQIPQMFRPEMTFNPLLHTAPFNQPFNWYRPFTY